jgi:hypothetical protein
MYVFSDIIACPTDPSKTQREEPAHTTNINNKTLDVAAGNKNRTKQTYNIRASGIAAAKSAQTKP